MYATSSKQMKHYTLNTINTNNYKSIFENIKITKNDFKYLHEVYNNNSYKSEN